MIKGLISAVIPNRNSPFLYNTIQDLLNNAGCDIEVIVNVDENWSEKLTKDSRVTYIHPNSPVGLRQGVNNCVKLAKGEFILKCDDHVAFGKDFGKTLIDNHQPNWVQIPRRYALDAENWKIEERTDSKYPIDYMSQDFPKKGKANDDGTHGVPWKERREERKEIDIDETPTMQGSCYFMTKDHFDNFLHGLSEVGYGTYAQESQEITFKTWLGGGQVMVNKKCWYAHLFKGKKYGRMYHLQGGVAEADSWSAMYWLNNCWEDRIHDFDWFINEKFPGMPGWPKDWQEQLKGMGWYE